VVSQAYPNDFSITISLLKESDPLLIQPKKIRLLFNLLEE